jgi:cell division septation protein DedD
MEQNKTYIIILIVTVVSAGLIAAGLFLFTPRGDADPELAARPGETFDPFIYLREPAANTGDEIDGTDGSNDAADAADGDAADDDAGEAVTAVAGSGDGIETPELLITRRQQVYGAIPGDGAGQTGVSDPGIPLNMTNDGPVGSDAAAQDAPDAASDNPVPVAGTPAPRSTSTGGNTAGSTAEPTARQSNEGKPAPESLSRDPVEVREYWIQVFASNSRTSVEDVRDDLMVHGFRGRISTVDSSGTLYYRLRFGPFSIKEEAEKFLEWLHNLPRYEGSYISLEYHYR